MSRTSVGPTAIGKSGCHLATTHHEDHASDQTPHTVGAAQHDNTEPATTTRPALQQRDHSPLHEPIQTTEKRLWTAEPHAGKYVPLPARCSRVSFTGAGHP